MLSWLRKHSTSTTAKVLYVFLAVTFFGGFGILSGTRFLRQKPVEESVEPIAIVNGEGIRARDFYQTYQRAKRIWYEQLRQLYGRVPEEYIDTNALKQEVLDRMIEQTLLLQEAKKLGIKVGEGEVNAEIASYSIFQDQSGRFSPQLFNTIIARYGLTPEQFREDVRRQILINRLLSLIVAPVSVSDEELKEYYQKAKEQINLRYFYIDADERYSKLEPTKEEIKQYYENHKKDFDWPETRKIRYIKIHIPDFEKKVKLSKDELKDYYEKSKERYLIQPEKAHIRNILIRVPENASEKELKEAEKKVQQILDELQSGADFAELAKKYSQDAQSAPNGGDLGWLSRDELRPEFAKIIFGLPVDGISQPIRSKMGFHILKLEDYKPAEYKPFKEVRKQVEKELIRNKAHQLAQEFAQEVARVCQTQGMEACAQKYNLELKESEWFKKREPDIEGIPDSMDITEEAFYMQEGEISEVIPGVDDLYIVELLKIKDPHQATLEEALPKILRRLTPQLRLKRAKEDMRALLEKMKKGRSIRWASRKARAKLEETGFFERGAKDIPGIGYSEEISNAIFNLDKENPYPNDVYDLDRKVYVLKLKDIKPADMSKFEEEKEQIRRELVIAKQKEIAQKYIEELKKGNIEIKTDILKRID